MPEFETTYQEDDLIDIDEAITEELQNIEHTDEVASKEEIIDTEPVSFEGINKNISQKETKKNENTDNTDTEKDNNLPQQSVSNDDNDNNNCGNNSNDNNDNDNSNDNANNKKTSTSTKNKIIFPKEFEYLIDIIRDYNNTLSLSNNKEFIQNALQENIKKEIAKSSKEIARKFANETIKELDKKDYFQKTQEYNQMKFIENFNIEDYKDKVNIVSLSKDELKEKLIFDLNEFYKINAEIVKGNKEYEDFFNSIFKIDVYVEDYFEL